MKEYLRILDNVIKNGNLGSNRTDSGAVNVFVENFRHDLRNGFPLLTTKKINPRQVFGELFAFLHGETTLEGFQKFGCNIWNSWGLEKDYVKLVLVPDEEKIERLRIALGKTPEEMTTYRAELDATYNAYEEKRIALINQVSDEKIPYQKAMQLMGDLEETRPIYYQELLHEHNIENYDKQVIYPKGYLGPIYGEQWLRWKTSEGELINQIKRVSDQLSFTPNSRRIIFTGWNPEFVPADKYEKNPLTDVQVVNSSDNVQASICDGKQALPPCHLMAILNTAVEDSTTVLNMHVIMRSTDVPLGLPYNIASYSALLMMMAKKHNCVAGEIVITMTNCHVYVDQVDLAHTQLEREPTELPTLTIPDDIDYANPETLTPESLERLLEGLQGYNPQAFIPYPRAV